MYELAILYRDGQGVRADAGQSFQLLQRAAEANYVPAMSLLSDAYANQKTAVSGERATYWATKAANAGDPRGWMTLGFEYEAGKLGGDSPYWYRQAMDAFKKAAAGGNCIAMMEIGDLYFRGNGVPADKTQAQSWQKKAQSCQGGNLVLLQQQVALLRARAVAARDPMLDPVLAALPPIPAIPKSVAAPGGSAPGLLSDHRILDGLVAGAVIVAALNVAMPKSASANSGGSTGGGLDSTEQGVINTSNRMACEYQVQTQLAGGYDSGASCPY